MKSVFPRIAVLAACLLASAPAWAGLEEGVAQFERKNYASAAQEFIPLARAGNGRAIYYLGVMSADGLGIPRNAENGFQAFRDSAKLGDSYGENALGVVLLNGEGTPRDVPAAVAWFEKAMAQDNPRAIVNMSTLRFAGNGVTQDDKLAIALLERAVALDWPDAMVRLGRLHDRGDGVPRDYRKARELYRRAGQMDDPAGEYEYVMSVLGDTGRKVVDQVEMSWLADSARQGYAPAQAWIGRAFETGLNEPQNLVKAAWWYEKAAVQGHVIAQYNLGVLLSHGAGDVPRDEREAARWFEAAALQGDVDAKYKLGYALAHAVGVKEDDVAARRWLGEAASAGDVPSMLEVAQLCRQSGPPVCGADEEDGWLLMAANKGSGEARSRLNDKYVVVRRVPGD